MKKNAPAHELLYDHHALLAQVCSCSEPHACRSPPYAGAAPQLVDPPPASDPEYAAAVAKRKADNMATEKAKADLELKKKEINKARLAAEDVAAKAMNLDSLFGNEDTVRASMTDFHVGCCP